MSNDKPFKTIEEQISLLKSRNLIFENEDTAKSMLFRYGYYEIINGYKDKFLVNSSNDNEGFLPNTTFEHIYALYKLDKNIRGDIKNSLEDFELSFKQALAYAISEEYSDNDSKYTQISHYDVGEAHRKRNGGSETDRDRLLWKLNFIIKYNEYEPYKHYREEHGNVPPWITVKGLSFGQSIFLYKLSKQNVRDKVVSKIFSLDYQLIPVIDNDFHVRQAFGDLLSLALFYRNHASHGDRVYNQKSNKFGLRYSKLLYPNIIKEPHDDFNHGLGRSSIGTLLCCLKIVENSYCYYSLLSWLTVHINEYLNLYPLDLSFLNSEMELNLTEINLTRKT